MAIIRILPLFLTLSTFFFMFSSFSSIASASSSSSSSSYSKLTIYDQLRNQGLPVGLFPKGITRYSINSTSGEFSVSMEQPCNVVFENQVHYDSNITGILGYGRIAQLAGVSTQELFLWFPVKGIHVDVPSSGLIHFDVGVADKKFSLALFEDPPDCTAHPQNPILHQAHTDGEEMLKADS